MARLNIDDEVWMDPRVQMLQRSIGENEALGQLLRFWKIAQLYWAKESLVPLDVFRFHNLSDELVNFGLAEVRPDGVYAKGSEQKFDWLKARIQSGKKGGIASGISRTNKNNDLIEANTKQNEPNRSKTKPPTLSPSLAPVPTLALDNKNKKESGNFSSLFETWKETLKHFGATRNLSASEQDQIFRGIQAHGEDSVRLALIGARYEPKFDGFNPKDHFSLTRVFDPKRFQKFLNLGAQNQNKATNPSEPDEFDKTLAEYAKLNAR